MVQITDMMLTIFYLIANDKFIIIYFSQVKASYVCLIFYWVLKYCKRKISLYYHALKVGMVPQAFTMIF